ncbi:unnamed protein product [Zymoseptoria tritici ST99CH_1A5]|uniref:Uncharacterized protein n=1 Tax=Zymoseptoria tritici ST99CH_1A5 TaxID=1276529 RepID=A0A1Y6L9L1_ZYMTR|nr:unnamed protein product [Zymoseptoria tritici ST99CH_3D1]SMY21177.1 unnamed protein product [Zymoseptoria tritici ST99CH_1A5]
MSPYLKGAGNYPRSSNSSTPPESQDRSRSDLALNTNTAQSEPIDSTDTDGVSNEGGDETAVPSLVNSADNVAGGSILQRSRSDYALNSYASNVVVTSDGSNGAITVQGGSNGESSNQDTFNGEAPRDKGKGRALAPDPSDDASSSSSSSSSDMPRNKGKAPVRDSTSSDSSGSDSSDSDASNGRSKALARRSEDLVTTDAATGRVNINFEDPSVLLPSPLPIRRKGGIPTAGGVVVGGGEQAKRLTSANIDRSESSNRLDVGPGLDGSNEATFARAQRLHGQKQVKKSTLERLEDLAAVVGSDVIGHGDSFMSPAEKAEFYKFHIQGKERALPNHRHEAKLLEMRGSKREFLPDGERPYKVAKPKTSSIPGETLRRIQGNPPPGSQPVVAEHQTPADQQRLLSPSNLGVLPEPSPGGTPDAQVDDPLGNTARVTQEADDPIASDTARGPFDRAAQQLQDFANRPQNESSSQPEAQPESILRPPRNASDHLESLGHPRNVDFAPRPHVQDDEAFYRAVPEGPNWSWHVNNPPTSREMLRRASNPIVQASEYLQPSRARRRSSFGWRILSDVFNMNNGESSRARQRTPLVVETHRNTSVNGRMRLTASFATAPRTVTQQADGMPSPQVTGQQSTQDDSNAVASEGSTEQANALPSPQAAGRQMSDPVSPGATLQTLALVTSSEPAAQQAADAQPLQPMGRLTIQTSTNAATLGATAQTAELPWTSVPTSQRANDASFPRAAGRQMSEPVSPGGTLQRADLTTSSSPTAQQATDVRRPQSPSQLTVQTNNNAVTPGTMIQTANPPTSSVATIRQNNAVPPPQAISRQMSEPTSPRGTRQMSEVILPGASQQLGPPPRTTGYTSIGEQYVPRLHALPNYENLRPRTQGGAGPSGSPLTPIDGAAVGTLPSDWSGEPSSLRRPDESIDVHDWAWRATQGEDDMLNRPAGSAPAYTVPGESDMTVTSAGPAPAETTQDDDDMQILPAPVQPNDDMEISPSDSASQAPRTGASAGPATQIDALTASEIETLYDQPPLTDRSNRIHDEGDNPNPPLTAAERRSRYTLWVRHREFVLRNAAPAANSRRRSSLWDRARDSIVALPKRTAEKVKKMGNRGGAAAGNANPPAPPASS